MPDVYAEHAPPRGLEDVVACVWTSHDGEVRVLPDACVDVVWSGGRLVVAGPATRAVVAPATPGQPRVGVRFRVGAAAGALGVPADELLDLGVDLAELWGQSGAGRIADRVAAAPTRAAAAAALVAGVGARRPPTDAADPLVRAAALGVTQAAGGVRDLGRMLGLSERQLLRRFRHAVGYGPRTLARVQRLQRFLALATSSLDAPPLARLAADVGYADQSHLARECRALAGVPPSALLAAGATPAGDPTLTGATG